MVTVSQHTCDKRHVNLRKWLVLGATILTTAAAVLVTGMGWTFTTCQKAVEHADKAQRDVHSAETGAARFHGQQTEFNRNTAATLKRIDTKVDSLWRKNGGGE